MSQDNDVSLDDVYEEKVEETEVTEVTEEPKPEIDASEVKAAQAEADPEIKPEVETTATTKPEKDEWTLTAVMDERDKRQKAVQRAEDLQAKLDAIEKPDDVSVFEDEKGYTEQQEQRRQAELGNAMLEMSKAYAVRDLGEEVVTKAEKWYADEGMKSPHAIDRIHKASLKFHEVVDLYNEEQVRLDPAGYKARLKAELMAEIKSEEPVKPITPSLASKRSAGGTEKTTNEDFEDILN
ncbi:MAG: hypothetical protein KOO63_08180 [Bacteroidales bacterium]|nr:hypothetical protein [Candidatus Latescibacterota bacterium]